MTKEETENSKTDNVEVKLQASDSFNVREFLHLIWVNKFWIILSVLICTALSYYFYKRQPKVYTSNAEIMLLVGNEDGSMSSGALAALADMEKVQGTNVNFFNELEIMRSPSLMQAVVERLNLSTSYTTEGFGHDEDLYGRSPVLVNFLDVAPDSTASLTLYKSKGGTIVAADFVSNGKKKQGNALRIRPGTVVQTPVGRLAISPTADFEKFPPYVQVTKNSVEAVAASLANQVVTSKKSPENSVVQISFNDVSQKRAIDIVNALIEAYNDLWIAEQTRSAANTSNFIKDRLAVIEKELSGIDSDISQVKSAHQVADFSAAASTYYGQSMNYDTKAFEANTQLSIAQFLRDYLNNSANASSLIPANTGTSGTIETQIQEYNKMLVKRDALLQNSTEANPVIAQMNSDLASNRALILASLNNLISTYQIEINRAQGRGREFSGKVSAVPEQEKQILSIERQQKVKENLYLYLLQKREENELSRMVTVNNTRVIRAAHGAGLVAGAMPRMLGIGFLIGLAIPLLIIFLYMRLDTKVKSKGDLAGLSIPYLGEMPLNIGAKKVKRSVNRLLHPRSRKMDDSELKLVVRDHSRSYINEAFRMLRTNLDFMSNSSSGCEVIMVTSFNPGSGKTFISLNLAKSLALKGKRVLVIDMDLRRASLSTYSGNPTQGVSTYLTGKAADISGLIRVNNSGSGIDLLPVGAIPPNPVELVLSDRFKEMVSYLRSSYDYIVLDCPPYDLVADTAIISKAADVTLFVVRAGLMSKNMLSEIEETYRNHKLPNMALILNGIQPKNSYYLKRYGYSSYTDYYMSDDDKDDDSSSEHHAG